MKQHILIIIPPLGTNSHKIGEKITKNWNKEFGIKPINWQYFWLSDEENYERKLKQLTDSIDELSNDDTIVSLLGLSGGGSVALNAFCQRKEKISKVVNIGGRLKSGNIRFPESKSTNDNNALFKESVILCEKNISRLHTDDKIKILTIRPLWDEFAPAGFAMIDGVKNIQIVAFGHILGIIASMTIYKKIVIDFLNQNRSSDK